jgi:acetylornithine/succinyldiaminopimelate/putrescine aminotransferase
LVHAVQPHSIRFAPPLIVNAGEVDRALAVFSRVLSTFVVESVVAEKAVAEEAG